MSDDLRWIRVHHGPPEGSGITIGAEEWIVEAYQEDPEAVWEITYEQDGPEAEPQSKVVVLRRKVTA